MTDVTVRGRVLRKALIVYLRRRSDNLVFHIDAPCILKLPDGLIHIVGKPNEELNTSVWNVTGKFEVLSIQECQTASYGN
jgi:hypothetical protein